MKTFSFYGVDNNCYKLNGIVWEAIEDPADGYRSYLGSIERKVETFHLNFPSMPIAQVFVRPNPEFGEQGFDLVDAVDGFVWLTVGTNDYENWYPCFVFHYNPKPPEFGTWKNFIAEGE